MNPADILVQIGEIEIQLQSVGYLLDDACNDAEANGDATAILREAEYEMAVAIGKLRAMLHRMPA